MNFKELLGIFHPTHESAVGADLSRLYLSPRQDAADLSAEMDKNLNSCPLSS
jgi:hypothetical protein